MDFKDELYIAGRNYDTKDKIEKPEERKGIEDAQNDYSAIKEELLDKARNGKYQNISGKHRIELYFDKSKIKGDFKLNRSSTRISKTIFNPKGKCAVLMSYMLINNEHYTAYMKEMYELCRKEEINIKPIGLYNYHNKDIKSFSIPGSIVGLTLMESYMSVCLECTVEYDPAAISANEEEVQYSNIDVRKECNEILNTMGYSVEKINIQKSQCDIMVYKNDVEYGMCCKIFEKEWDLEDTRSTLYDCIKGIEYLGDSYTEFFLKSYYSGQGFSNIKINSESATLVIGYISRKSIQYKVKYYCEEGYRIKNNIYKERKSASFWGGDTKDNCISKEQDFDKMEGHEFERFCAKLLEKNGYDNVEVTKESGDQGVDIIAYLGGVKYGIQCKCYSVDIGNKAVQEVYAGKTYYHCHVGVVLTNRNFTKSAIELAERNGVILWNREKLLELLRK